jgi:hypothetical protein
MIYSVYARTEDWDEYHFISEVCDVEDLLSDIKLYVGEEFWDIQHLDIATRSSDCSDEYNFIQEEIKKAYDQKMDELNREADQDDEEENDGNG